MQELLLVGAGSGTAGFAAVWLAVASSSCGICKWCSEKTDPLKTF